MLETDALKEKLEMELHRFARPPEELSSGDPYFEQLQTMLAIRDELINIPLCDIQRNMLLSMENVLESAWSFRNTPVPDRCMNPNNISEVVYYFLQDKGAEYRGDLLYERAKAEFDARMEELAALPPKEILDHAYEKIIKEDFLCHLEEGLDEWETDALLSYPQPLTALYTEWMGNDYSYLDIDRIQSTATQAAGKRLNELRRHEFDVNGEPPVELRYFYDLHSEILDNPDLEWVGDIFRNRTIIGAVCILLAVLVCFGITPLFNAGLKAQTEAVRVKAEVIPRGTYITADMVEVYTRGASGMPDSIATSLDEVVGRYTDVELRKNTDVNTGWLSSEPLTQYEYLTKLDGSKVAISVTIPTFAKGGSGKVEAGDIIMLFATDKDTGETTQPPELKYVEVLAATQSSGADKEYQAPQEDEEENPEESLPSTITLLVNTEQAQILAHLEESNSLHLAFVYRGTRENAEKFLAAQDQFFVEPEEATAAQDGEQGEVSDDNHAADSTGDNAAGNEPAEQEVENTDGE